MDSSKTATMFDQESVYHSFNEKKKKQPRQELLSSYDKWDEMNKEQNMHQVGCFPSAKCTYL